MKKITTILFLFVSIICFAQQKDSYNYRLFEELKKIPIDIEDEKDIFIEQYDKIISETKDDELKILVTKTRDELKRRNFNNSVKSKDLSILTKDDLKGLKIQKDKFTNTINIYNNNNTGNLRLSIFITSKQNMYLRLTSYYKGPNWIFYKYLTILSGNETFDFIFEDVKRETGRGYVEENSSILLDKEKIELLREILNSNNEILLRFFGDKVYDIKLSKSDIEKMKRILITYDKLK